MLFGRVINLSLEIWIMKFFMKYFFLEVRRLKNLLVG